MSCPSSIRCQDSNPRPLKHESSPITTRLNLYSVFGLAGNATEIIYANWYSNAMAGVFALGSYSPSSKEWKEAHAKARYVLMQVTITYLQTRVTRLGYF